MRATSCGLPEEERVRLVLHVLCVMVERLGGLDKNLRVNPVAPGQGGGWPDANATYEYYSIPPARAPWMDEPGLQSPGFPDPFGFPWFSW